MVFALFLAIPIKATSLEKEKEIKIETSIDIQINTVSLQNNFVNLSMETPERNWFEEVTPINKDVLKGLQLRKINYPNVLQRSPLEKLKIQELIYKSLDKSKDKKEELIISKIREYIPEFSKQNALEYQDVLFIRFDNNYTHYYLKHEAQEIRLISFKEIYSPIEIKGSSISVSVEESYY